MRRFFAAAFAAALVLPAIPVHAQNNASAIAAKMAAMDYFNGSWTCAGKNAKTGKTGQSTITMTKVMNGQWQRQTFDSKSMATGKPYHSETYVTYNPKLHRYVSLGMGSAADYGVSGTPGWTGNTLLWTDTLAGDNLLGRTTLTRQSATSLAFAIYGQNTPGGAIVKQSSGTCTKSTAAVPEGTPGSR